MIKSRRVSVCCTVKKDENEMKNTKSGVECNSIREIEKYGMKRKMTNTISAWTDAR